MEEIFGQDLLFHTRLHWLGLEEEKIDKMPKHKKIYNFHIQNSVINFQNDDIKVVFTFTHISLQFPLNGKRRGQRPKCHDLIRF